MAEGDAEAVDLQEAEVHREAAGAMLEEGGTAEGEAISSSKMEKIKE